MLMLLDDRVAPDLDIELGNPTPGSMATAEQNQSSPNSVPPSPSPSQVAEALAERTYSPSSSDEEDPTLSSLEQAPTQTQTLHHEEMLNTEPALTPYANSVTVEALYPVSMPLPPAGGQPVRESSNE